MGTIFVSHATADRPFVERVVLPTLESLGLDPWYSARKIASAAEWQAEIVAGLESSEWILVVLSPRSVESPWVRSEVHFGFEREPPRVVPVLLEDCDARRLHLRLPTIQHVDARSSSQGLEERLATALGLAQRADPGELARSPMGRLVSKFERCRTVDGRMVLCKYHRDRIEVRLLEQSSHEGERALDDGFELSPSPALLHLFRGMDSKTEAAGHWGLMLRHRQWLAGHLEQVLEARPDSDAPLRILQCGIAGFVHYFGTLDILLEAVDRLRAKGREPRIEWTTYDICPGSIRQIEAGLERLRAGDARRDVLAFDGVRVVVDPTFRELEDRRDLLDPAVVHHLRVGDVTSPYRFADEPERFDLVMTHYLFDMWVADEPRHLSGFASNLAACTAPSCDLLFAVNAERAGHELRTTDYLDAFESLGFRLADSEATWDIYDLEEEVRDRFLVERRPIRVPRESLLWRLERQS